MIEEEVKILFAKICWDRFEKWIKGQTVGVGKDGEINYYKHDVERFVRYRFNPDNEPVSDFD